MVKGVSRQVIVVQSPEPKLFDQAIFILKEDALGVGISDDALMREAQKILRSGAVRSRSSGKSGLLWAFAGAMLMGAVWLMTYLI